MIDHYKAAEAARELCYAIEELPASEQQTAISIKASNVSTAIQRISAGLTGRQQAEGKAHALFHEPMAIGDVETGGEIDWATIHGPEGDNPETYVQILREHLLLARREIVRLRAYINQSTPACKNV
jgi:hypothetical protein